MRVAREQVAGCIPRRAETDATGLTGRAREEFFHAVELDLHGAAHAAREQRRDHVDRIEVEPAPEVAADGRLHHAHAIAGDPERLREVALVEERHLGRRPHGEVALPIPVGERDHRFQAGRGHEVQPIFTLHHHRRVRERAVDVPVRELVAQRGDVRRHLVVDERRARLDGGERIEDGRQFLVLDVDQLHGGLREPS